jgi:hypothetical protein
LTLDDGDWREIRRVEREGQRGKQRKREREEITQSGQGGEQRRRNVACTDTSGRMRSPRGFGPTSVGGGAEAPMDRKKNEVASVAAEGRGGEDENVRKKEVDDSIVKVGMADE